MRPITLHPVDLAQMIFQLSFLFWIFGKADIILPVICLLLYNITSVLLSFFIESKYRFLRIYYSIYFLYTFLFWTFAITSIFVWRYEKSVSIESILYSFPLVAGFMAGVFLLVGGIVAFITTWIRGIRSLQMLMFPCVIVLLLSITGIITAPLYMYLYPSMVMEYAPMTLLCTLSGLAILNKASREGKILWLCIVQDHYIVLITSGDASWDTNIVWDTLTRCQFLLWKMAS